MAPESNANETQSTVSFNELGMRGDREKEMTLERSRGTAVVCRRGKRMREEEEGGADKMRL